MKSFVIKGTNKPLRISFKRKLIMQLVVLEVRKWLVILQLVEAVA